MRKSLQVYIAENDEEYTYFVKSVNNIHDDEIIDQIKIAMLPYQVKDMERDSITPMRDKNNDFPEFPFTKTFALKVITGLELELDAILQQLAFYTKLPWKEFIVHKKGEKIDREDDVETVEKYKSLADTAETFDGTADLVVQNAGDDVGEKRITSLMSELETERKEREERAKAHEKDMYESFVTSHIVLGNFLKDPKYSKKGFYLVERQTKDSDLSIKGPFSSKPINYEFSSSYFDNLEPVSIIESKNRILVELSRREDAMVFDDRPENEAGEFELSVMDQDTGKEYNVLVRADDENEARNKGVEIVSREEGILPVQLLVVKPDME